MTTFPALRIWPIAAAFLTLFFADFAAAQTSLEKTPGKATVSGKFIGNGKNAAIKFVTVAEEEPFNGKEALMVVFTEQDPSKSKKLSFDAGFGKLGSALILRVFHDGKIFGCEVSHSAHQKKGFSSIGEIKLVDFKIADGTASGRVSTGKELDTFGEKWEVDLNFSAPVPAKKNMPAGESKPAASEAGEPAKKAPKAAVGPLKAARKLPLPKDATDVEYKALVKHIQFSSARSVEAETKEFSANLKQDGWKDGTGSLATKKNAILKRELGEAKLTIMIQPAAAGSVVKIFTEGLDWSGGEEAKPVETKKAAPTPSVEGVEADANKVLKDALELVPKGR